jgi:DNA primase large subunit
MNKAETTFREAFDRLKADTPINVPKGTKISQNNIAKEARKHPTALKKDRFPLLVLEIQDYLKQQEIDSDTLKKKKQLRKQRTLEQRLSDCKKQRDKLASICEAQSQYIEQFQYDVSELEKRTKKSILPL